MSKPLTKIFLMVSVLLGSAGVSSAADFQRGLAAHNRGDFNTALREYKLLAEQGDARAQSLLGGMYELGQGVPQDDKAAAKWYRLAAEQGNASAQYNLGAMYDLGQGVPQDDKAAVKWYRLAAEQGNAYAQNKLGWMYGSGRGVPQDHVYAHMWFNLAAASGNEQALKTRDYLAKDMTSAQIAKAQRLATECVRKKYKGCETKY
jgi:uncharacterized protein